jgi:hypothetical protein
MKFTTSDKFIAYLTLLSGLIISAVAIWYSVAGLMAIFAAAAVPIMIMGVALEGSKLIATIWLKWNWHRAPLHIKAYLLSAIAVLMIITSMGIFGFLSKAHLDQSIPTGDVVAQVSLIDEKINNEREIIANARTLVKQLDDAVVGIQSGQGRELRNRDGTTRIENPAERALQVRRSQAVDRAALTKTIDEAQARIVKLQEEKAPIAGQLREVEAKVGPIKYIAALIYGDDSEHSNLESAVRWVIIVIVLVFDPLAVVLLLASQYSFQWFRQEREQEQPKYEHDDGPLTDDQINQIQESVILPVESDADKDARLVKEANDLIAEIEKPEPDITLLDLVEPELPASVAEDIVVEELDVSDTEKAAMKRWKAENPNDSLKHQRKLFESGLIKQLPWNEYLKARADFIDDESAAAEAAKWALEQVEKKTDLTYVEKTGKEQIVKPAGYQQNAEQGSDTIWNRIKDKKSNDEQ